MFNLMDTNSTGMITYDQFYNFLNAPKPKTDLITHKEIDEPERRAEAEKDSFDWQYHVIDKMKAWFKSESIF